MQNHTAQTLEVLFRDTFFEKWQTVLCGGADEPLYETASQPGGVHHIWYRHDYFASALHEVAHWCIAGRRRRLLTDYGYWYDPDGRDQASQQAFMKVEVKPQALELLFCAACGYPFRVSLDNVSGECDGDAVQLFQQHVWQQAHAYLHRGLPLRASHWVAALLAHWQPGHALCEDTLNQVFRRWALS